GKTNSLRTVKSLLHGRLREYCGATLKDSPTRRRHETRCDQISRSSACRHNRCVGRRLRRPAAQMLRACNVETHLIVSRAAQMTLAYETSFKLADVERLATVVHPNSDVGAACSSG